jgi:hypothetical protein
MVVSTIREVASCAATQESHRILLNPKVHYRVHKSSPHVCTQNQMNALHTIPFSLSLSLSPSSILIFSTHLWFCFPSVFSFRISH